MIQLGEPTAPGCARICAQVRLVEHLGRETIVYADTAPRPAKNSDSGTSNITVQRGAVAQLAPGENIAMSLSPLDTYLFSADGETISTFAHHNLQ